VIQSSLVPLQSDINTPLTTPSLSRSTRVATFFQNPFDHISFGRSCAAVRRAYDPRFYRRLCHVYGFARPGKMRETASWCRHFENVVEHCKACSEYGCRHYGAVGEPHVHTRQTTCTDVALAPGTSGCMMRSADHIRAFVDKGGK
jgi:hypothetical protein